jgi:hypothetical protein
MKNNIPNEPVQKRFAKHGAVAVFIADDLNREGGVSKETNFGSDTIRVDVKVIIGVLVVTVHRQIGVKSNGKKKD